MFSWMSGLQNPLVQNDFNMFLDEWTSVKVSSANAKGFTLENLAK